VVYNVNHDYPLEGDIVTSLKNLDVQEKKHKHKFGGQ